MTASRSAKPIATSGSTSWRRPTLIARQLEEWSRELAQVQQELAAIPPLPTVWIGHRVEADAAGPHHVFIGGSPQRPGDEVVPASLSTLAAVAEPYTLPADAPESQRRQQLADWMVGPDNPLTPRVLANRVWHYHFGTGIVDTPSDFGYMGGRPTHPLLLDWLAGQLPRTAGGSNRCTSSSCFRRHISNRANIATRPPASTETPACSGGSLPVVSRPRRFATRC